MRSQTTRTIKPGFTLTELIVGVVIMTVLTGIAYPTVARQAIKTKLEAAAYTISTDLEGAFSLAARQKRPVTFAVDGTNLRYMVQDRATSLVLLDRWLGDKDSPWGVTQLGMNVASITVFPNGLASQGATIRVAITNQVRSVVLTRTGLVRITVP
ncbi:MAG: prepilin-type N-terminal cleavage/methylation domain-containing protein [Gemmatimonadetes bacterium]|nr:prepilin-type N-terminal cleavage/methylation domain-containing protein [Gemmatimonadota bacterium]